MTWGRGYTATGEREIALGVMAGASIFILGCELEAMGMSGLSARHITSQAAIGEAADLALDLTWSLDGVEGFERVVKAGREAFLALSKDAERVIPVCAACTAQTHPEGTHSVEARLGSDEGHGSAPICGCSCQRRPK